MRIEWSRQTQADFRCFLDFLNSVNPDAAIRAAQDIRQQIKILINNPGAGTAIDDGTGDRELYIQSGKHGYVVRYKPLYDAKLIRVLQIWHGREDR